MTGGILTGLVLGSAAATAGAQVGGAYSTPAPRISSVVCQTECSGSTYARPGSLVAIRGSHLRGVARVTFLGSSSRRKDDRTVKPQRASAARVLVRVPRGAASGRIRVTSGDGQPSRPSRTRLSVDRIDTRRVSSGPGPGIELAVTGRKVFFGADRKPTVTFKLHDSKPVHVVVEVLRAADGVAVARLDQGLVPPGEMRSVSWDGTTDGAVAPDGRYEFRIFAENAEGARASTSQTAAPGKPSPESFMFLGHRFPVRGAHDYGEFGASFGGGRNHQGQDVFAKCGTPLVAARGGKVKIQTSHSRAGHYVVIDGEQTDVDYIYMHLRDKALVKKGERVRTGQLIGHVGDTGRAHGCHLHFELWSGPGWYTGGSPMDPLPFLKAWDRFS